MKISPVIRKKWFGVILILTIISPTVISMAVNLAVDPFEIFSKDKGTPQVFLGGRGQDRYQHVGVIRQYQPKSIIIGHSHAANFLPTSVEKLLNWQDTYSLTLDGGPIYEQRRITEYALQHSKIENVLWLFDPHSLGAAPNMTNRKMPFPEYLYDMYRINDLTLFATLPKEFRKYANLKEEKRHQLDQEIEQSATTIDPRDRSTSWYFSTKSRFNHPNKIADVILGKKPKTLELVSNPDHKHGQGSTKADDFILSHSTNFDANVQNLLSIALKYPEVHFTFIASSPFPKLFQKKRQLTNYSLYIKDLSYVRAFVKETSSYKNIEVFGFGLEKFTADLRLYKDAKHYHIAVNEFMLNAISIKSNKLTTENIDEFLVDFDDAINIYHLPEKWFPKNRKHKKRKTISLSKATNIIASYQN